MMRRVALMAVLLAPVLVQAAEQGGLQKQKATVDQVVEQPAAGEFPTVVLPDATTSVRLSSSDMNRISCPADIREALTSTEKGLTIKITGKDVFVKFKVIKKVTSLPTRQHQPNFMWSAVKRLSAWSSFRKEFPRRQFA